MTAANAKPPTALPIAIPTIDLSLSSVVLPRDTRGVVVPTAELIPMGAIVVLTTDCIRGDTVAVIVPMDGNGVGDTVNVLIGDVVAVMVIGDTDGGFVTGTLGAIGTGAGTNSKQTSAFLSQAFSTPMVTFLMICGEVDPTANVADSLQTYRRKSPNSLIISP